jgi:apolipoprotein N-acyltransferase
VRRAAGLGLLAGLLLTATLPPWGWWVLGPVGAAVLALALRGRPAKVRAVCGLAAGIGLYAPGLFWMSEFSLPGYPLAVLIEAAFIAFAMLVVVPGPGRLVALPAALVLAEAARGSWPFGGVPLAHLALGQVGGPLAPAARVSGQLLLVGLVGLAGAGLAEIVAAARRRARPHGAVAGGLALGVVGAVALLGAAGPAGRTQGRLRVALIQGGGERGILAVEREDPTEVFDAQLRASGRVEPPVDLVLWPEDVVDVSRPVGQTREGDALSDLARDLDATVIAGIVEDADERHFRNAAVAWGPDGRIVDRFDKVHRVPFGEYIPFRGFFDVFADLSAVPSDAIPGKGAGLLETEVGRLGVVISYEVFFEDRARAAVRARGGVLLVPTNASSFSTGQVPAQELAAARLRALETGRTVLQAAPTGYTAVVDWRGRVLQRTALGGAAVLERTVETRTGTTWATQLGPRLAVVLAVLTLVVVWLIENLSAIPSGFLARRSEKEYHVTDDTQRSRR